MAVYPRDGPHCNVGGRPIKAPTRAPEPLRHAPTNALRHYKEMKIALSLVRAYMPRNGVRALDCTCTELTNSIPNCLGIPFQAV